ncbi:MAG: DUF2341 domain-containing protein [Fibrobacter sp.]|nr:DUF2341 domain-containing protein [Fibrobacter sp.]
MKKRIIVLSLIAAFICQCGLGPDFSGGSTNTGNARIAGVLINNDGTRASQAFVFCIPSDYIPGISKNSLICQTITNDSGVYTFDSLSGGSFVITAKHPLHATRSYTSCSINNNDTLKLPEDTLDNPGFLRIAIPDNAIYSKGFFYIPGTTIASIQTNSTPGNHMYLDSVPQGIVESVRFLTLDDTTSRVIRYQIPVTGGDTLDISNIAWKYARTVLLNTTETGANVSSDVTGFPVLIRLSQSNFDFSLSSSDGSDLRFTKKDNTLLPFEIEYWNAVSSTAALWVKVDTIYGNNNTQSITMYYGNPAVVTSRMFSPVFDSSNGYMGVWHLGDTSNVVTDASANKFTGTKLGALQQQPGMIGMSQLSTDGTGYGDLGNILNPEMNNFTISAWYKRTGKGLNTIIAKGPGFGVSPSATYGWCMGFNFYDQFHCLVASGGNTWEDTGTFSIYTMLPLDDTTTWHNVTAVIDRSDNNNCKLYFDAISQPYYSSGDIRTVGSISNTDNLRIGTDASSKYTFKGYIDECTMAYTARSADWVKLCFMNQRRDDKLVKFKSNF